MAASASIRVVKQFTYRGVLRNFSNRYHFTNGAPSDSAHWTTLSDAIVTAEKAMNAALASGGAKIIASVGYDAGSEIPVFNKTYATDGTMATGGITAAPGDVAGLIRYSTSVRSSKNHPVYLFNYYHAVFAVVSGAASDTWYSTQKTAAGVYAAAWIAGFSDGTTNHIRCGPNGAVATGHLEEPYLTHRDLPR
jgi:hypothetical protein